MRQMTRPPGVPRDPAPSRVRYKLQRMWLTPGYRRMLRTGLPLLVTGTVLLALFQNPERQVAAANMWIDARRAVEERPEFMVKMMALDGASEALAGEIRATMPLDFPLSSFDVDLEAVRQRVETLNAVSRAEVRIAAGGVLQVKVEERVPALVWRTGEGLWLIDETGHPVMPVASRSARPELPLVAGPGADLKADEALALIAAAAPLQDRLRGLVRRGERRWDLVLDREQRILLPEADPVKALERLIALDQADEMLARDLSVVDIRNPRRPTLRMAQGAVEELRRIRGLEGELGSQ